MDVSFINGYPALFVKHERLIVVGDLHIGRDISLKKSGVHIANATDRLLESLILLYKKEKAKGIVLLGDVKESIGYPPKEEYQELARFFYGLRGIDVTIAKGNHDAQIENIVSRLQADARVVKELLLEKVALMHGNALPSSEAMKKNCIVTAHSHPAVSLNGRYEKAWIVARIGRPPKRYKGFNRKAMLVVMPAFNELITGSDPSGLSRFAPQFRNKIFDLRSAKIYGLDNKLLGKVSEYGAA